MSLPDPTPLMKVHPTAVVESGAQIGAGVSIGPFCHVGPRVKLADGVSLLSHVTVSGATEIGPRTVVSPFAALGGPPQHLGHRGEETRLVIGADNVIREHVTMNTGTVAGGGVTRVGARGFYMTGAHIGHDCQVGDEVILANNATLGGHVKIEDNVFLGGLCAIHQHCRVGAYAFIGGCAAVPTDVIPFASAYGNHARLAGLNIIGLKRRGLSRELIHDLRAAYRQLFAAESTFEERLAEVESRYGHRAEVKRIVAFIRDGTRPLMTPAR